MEFKIVIADSETGKSYQQEIKDNKAKKVNGKMIGDELDGAIFGLAGYTLKITGGSDKGGFPMKKGVLGKGALRILMKEGVGYRKKGKLRKRKRVIGEIISEDITQINMKITVKGKKSIDELLSVGEKEEK